MSDEKSAIVKFDSWSTVETAIKKSVDDTTKGATRLVAVLFAASWHPASMHSIKEIEKFRRPADSKPDKESANSLTPAFKFPIFIIDIDTPESSIAINNPTVTSPGPVFKFFISGTPLIIRRPAYSDDEIYYGSPNKTNLIELFQCARAAENNGNKLIHIEF